jgi:4-carboxymuconolactone decarboxylase
VVEYEDELRNLASNDETFVQANLGISLEVAPSRLDPKTKALVRLAALIAVDGSAACYRWSVDAATAAGATADEIVGALVAVAATAGLARSVSAAPPVASALGYDLDEALETLDVGDG